MNLYIALYLAFLFPVTLGCKSEPKKMEQIEVTTNVVDAAVQASDHTSALPHLKLKQWWKTKIGCERMSAIYGFVWREDIKSCMCPTDSEWDANTRKCVEKKSKAVSPDKNFEAPMDNLTEADEVDAPTAEEVATAKKDAPRLMKEWRDHGWKTPRYLLRKYLVEYGLSPKQLGITQEDAEEILNK